MKIVAKEDIEAPIAKVFSKVTDFRTFERSAIRRGATVTRLDDQDELGEGMRWEAVFGLRGKKREMRLELTECDEPERLCIVAVSDGLTGHVLIDLVALSRTRTRLRIETEFKPQTLSARLLVQSLKLARGNLQNRLQKRLSEFCATIGPKASTRA